jgi:hypothetical protein
VRPKRSNGFSDPLLDRLLQVSSRFNHDRVARRGRQMRHATARRTCDGTNLAFGRVPRLPFVKRTGRDLALGLSFIFNLPVLYQHQDAPACLISID